jgi:hypothetical protein
LDKGLTKELLAMIDFEPMKVRNLLISFLNCWIFSPCPLGFWSRVSGALPPQRLTAALFLPSSIACIRDAESILIFGPGEAKGGLQKRIAKNNLGARIVGIETVDKMTDRQIAAKVRQYFQENSGQL